MKRLTIAAILATVLLGNNGMPKKYWAPSARASQDTTATAVVSEGVPAYVVRWFHLYNAALKKARTQLQVVGLVHCHPDGEALEKCVAVVQQTTTQAVGCYRVTITSAETLWGKAPRINCKTAVKDPPPTA